MDIMQLRAGAKAFINNNGRNPESSDNPQKAIIGEWTVKEVICDIPTGWTELPPLSALNPCSDWPKYDSIKKIYGNNYNVFALTNEKNAKIIFLDSNKIKTTLFFSNYGESTYYFNPKTDSLKIKFSDKSQNIENTPFSGKFLLKNSTEAIWSFYKKEFHLVKN